MSRGIANWTQPWHGQHFMLDGHRFDGDYDFRMTPTDQPAVRVRMQSGLDVRVRRLESQGFSAGGSYYSFQWTMVPDDEAEWHKVRGIAAVSEPVWLIPYVVETEAWRAAGGSETFTLRRPTAKSVFAGFESVYVSRVFLDGVEQTLVETGSPATGEISVLGSSVVVPSDVTASQLVTVRYYPAFPVDIDRSVLNVEGHNAADSPVVASEVGGVSPASF